MGRKGEEEGEEEGDAQNQGMACASVFDLLPWCELITADYGKRIWGAWHPQAKDRGERERREP